MAIDSNTLQRLSLKAVEALKKHPIYQQSKVIGIYHPIKHEMDITSIIHDDKVFGLPKVVGSDMQYYRYTIHSQLEKSSLSIMETYEGEPLDSTLDLIIVPALAVSKTGQRVGYGKGFFDRFIENNPHIYTLCIVFDFQVVDTIPHTPQDKKVHDIIRIHTEVAYDY
jgi:5-formyltetrahydrofolate cyclo-ligase